MRALQINVDSVELCYADSFEGGEGDESFPNPVLLEDTIEQKNLAIFLRPTLLINGMPYRGYLDGKDVLKAVC